MYMSIESKIILFNPSQLNDLRNLSLSKESSQLIGSRLKQHNMFEFAT